MSAPTLQLNDSNTLPIIGLGTYQAEKGVIAGIVSDAIDVGYRHFDCAYFYQNQQEIGEAINKALSDGKVSRDEIYIVTKVWPTFYGKGRVMKCAKLMLQQFNVQYIDLLLLHWPVVFADDDNELMPKDNNGNIVVNNDYDIVDVYKELEEVKRLGFAKSIGVSNFNSQQIERVLRVATIVPAMNQVECHPYLNQQKLLDFCRERGIALTAYSPLARGGTKPGVPSLLEDTTIKRIAAKHSKTEAQVIIRWQTQRGVGVIPKSVTKQRIVSNFDIFDFNLSDEDMAAINGLNRDLRIVKFDTAGLSAQKDWPFGIPF